MCRGRFCNVDGGIGPSIEFERREVKGAKPGTMARKRSESPEVCVMLSLLRTFVRELEGLELRPSLREGNEIGRGICHEEEGEVRCEVAQGTKRQQGPDEFCEGLMDLPPVRYAPPTAAGPSESGEGGALRDQRAKVAGQLVVLHAGFGEGKGSELQSVHVSDKGTDSGQLECRNMYALESAEHDWAIQGFSGIQQDGKVFEGRERSECRQVVMVNRHMVTELKPAQTGIQAG